MGVIVSRKFLAGFLIIAILSLMLPVHQAHAGAKELGKTFLTGAGKVAKAAPGFLWGAAKVGAGIIGTAMLLKFLSGVIVELAGLIFNMSLGLTLDNENYSSSKIDAIDAGWTFSRDVVNIFFIFILLFIAIATILGIESYGAKSLLARLIVVALLVNFSLLATRGIIYVSNSLAVQIYNSQVNIGDTAGTAGALSGFLNLKFKKNLGEQVMNRFYLKQLYEKAPKPDSASALANELLGFGTIELGAIVVALLAAFLLFVASFLFITRMAVLWLLMILAPFGFVFLILPATRSYAQQWWKKLIDQAVFAPAFLFLFFIALKVLGSLGDLIDKAGKIESETEFVALLLLQVTMAFILLFASLMVAKQLGVYGADGAIGMANKGGTWTRGFAARHTIGRGAAKLRESRLGQAITQRSPLAYKALNRGARVGGFDEKVVKERMSFLKSLKNDTIRAEQFGKLPLYMQNITAKKISARELAGMHDKGSSSVKTQIDQAVRNLSTEQSVKYHDERAKIELKGPFGALVGKWGTLSGELQEAIIENTNKEQLQKLTQEFDKLPGGADNFALDVNRHRADRVNDVLSVAPGVAARIGTTIGKTTADAVREIDFEKIREDHLANPRNSIIMDQIVAQAKPTQIQKIINRGDSVSVRYREELMKYDASGSDDLHQIAVELRAKGNKGTADWLETVPGKRALEKV